MRSARCCGVYLAGDWGLGAEDWEEGLRACDVELSAGDGEDVVSGVPQLSQNEASGSLAVPHELQVNSSFVPHALQNFALPRFSVVHCKHCIALVLSHSLQRP